MMGKSSEHQDREPSTQTAEDSSAPAQGTTDTRASAQGGTEAPASGGADASASTPPPVPLHGVKPAPKPPAARRCGIGQSLAGFFLLRDRLQDVRRRMDGVPSSSQQAWARSREARDAAQKVLVRRRHKADGDDLASVCLLLRDSLWWAARAVAERLVAPQHMADTASPADAWALLEVEPETSGLATLAAHERQAARAAWVERTSFTLRQQPREQLAADVEHLTLALEAIQGPLDRDARTLAHLVTLRRSRWAVTLLAVLSAVAVPLGLRASAKRPNLALNRPTKASSHYANNTTSSGVVDGKTRGVGVHTDRDKRPWVRIDLEKVQQISEVTVYNADHCCFERVARLVINVSTDGKEYKEVARNGAAFGVWKARFAPVSARFVELSLDEWQYLHLSEVEVR